MDHRAFVGMSRGEMTCLGHSKSNKDEVACSPCGLSRPTEDLLEFLRNPSAQAPLTSQDKDIYIGLNSLDNFQGVNSEAPARARAFRDSDTLLGLHEHRSLARFSDLNLFSQQVGHDSRECTRLAENIVDVEIVDFEIRQNYSVFPICTVALGRSKDRPPLANSILRKGKPIRDAGLRLTSGKR